MRRAGVFAFDATLEEGETRTDKDEHMSLTDYSKLCDAQNRYAIAAGIDPHVPGLNEFQDRKADGRDELLHTLWSMLDATSCMTLRLGDGPVQDIDVDVDADLVGDVLALGTLTIDLSTAKVERANDSHVPCCFLVDGVPLRITYSAWHVDATIEVLARLAEIVDEAKTGGNAGVSVTIDGRTEILQARQLRTYRTKFGDRTSRFGSLLTYRVEGPVLDVCSDGSVEGIDYEGRFVRIAAMPAAEPLKMAA